MRVEHLPSRVLQKKFEEWFGDLIPADTDHSIEDPDPADFRFHTAKYNPFYIHRSRRVKASPKQADLFIFGLQGAALTALGVGGIIFMMYTSDLGWSTNWPSPIFFIFLAMVIGFWGGMVGGSIYNIREK